MYHGGKKSPQCDLPIQMPQGWFDNETSPATKLFRNQIRWQKPVFAEEAGPSQILSWMATIKKS